MTLTKYEQDAIANLEYQFEYIQEFLDEHIKGSNSMTARDIYDKFCEEYECVETPKDFIFGLKAAIKVKRIKGVEGVRGVGYHRVGEPVTRGGHKEDAFASLIEPLNSFLDKNLRGNKRMPAKEIYNVFSRTNDCSLSEEEFIKGFRLAVSNNEIKGLASCRRAGYGRAGAEPEVKEVVVAKPEPTFRHRERSYDPNIKMRPAFEVIPELRQEWEQDKSKALLRIKQLVYDHKVRNQKVSASIYRYAAAQMMNGDTELKCIGSIDLSDEEVKEVVGF